jgi:tryptophan halogenase
MTDNIVIVGGGTAGWVTALLAQKFFPNIPTILVESAEVGILGAGEGTTPNFVNMLNQVNIPISELIKNTSSTIKQGISFENWNSLGSSFFHGFKVHGDDLGSTALNHMGKDFSWKEASLMNYYLAHKKIDFGKTDLQAISSFSNKVLFVKKEDSDTSKESIKNFKDYGTFALHFDAQAIAKYLSSVAQSRGVQRIESKLKKVNLDASGYIKDIDLESGQSISGSFFFDCTGFARLIAVKELGSEWHTFKDSLPAKRAMPFFLGINKKEIPPYTLAKAMEMGWLWQIPLQHRFGCGYAYDPDRISDDDVKKEIDDFAGVDVEIPRIFNFEPGFVLNPWNKNCLAIGLASGFVEPLEATSIFHSLNMLNKFFERKNSIFSKDEQDKQNFNNDIADGHHSIASFIYLHYMTDKTNNRFWKNFALDYKMPKGLEKIVHQLQEDVFTSLEAPQMFNVDSFFKVALGNNILNQKNLSEIYHSKISGIGLKEAIAAEEARRNDIVNMAMNHSDFLIEMGADLNEK